MQACVIGSKRTSLTNNNPLDTVHDTSAGAHVTRGKGGVHGCSLVGGSWQPSRILEAGDLGLPHVKLDSTPNHTLSLYNIRGA